MIRSVVVLPQPLGPRSVTQGSSGDRSPRGLRPASRRTRWRDRRPAHRQADRELSNAATATN